MSIKVVPMTKLTGPEHQPLIPNVVIDWSSSDGKNSYACAVTLYNNQGIPVLRVKPPEQSYQADRVVVEVPKPPKTETKWRVTAKADGGTVTADFDTEAQAKEFVRFNGFGDGEAAITRQEVTVVSAHGCPNTPSQESSNVPF